jgi:hypothetical protein
MVNNSVKTDILLKAQESADSYKKYYYKIKQSTNVKNIHDNILRDYMYVEDDSPDLKGVIEWMKMVIDIEIFRQKYISRNIRQKYISVDLCTTHEFAKNYNSKSDSISVTQAEYLYGVNKIEHVDVICFNSIEEVYDDFERLNAENEKNGRPFEDALIYHLSDAENNKEYIELLEYE